MRGDFLYSAVWIFTPALAARRRGCAAALLAALLVALTSCMQQSPVEQSPTVVFKHGKIAGDPAHLRALLDEFERRNPGIAVKDETLPASTDEQHQYYVINLEAMSADFDVLSMDVIWVPEFARAGWLRDLSHLLPPGERDDFFPGPVEADRWAGRMYAVPWYIDAGLLYYRIDLLRKHGLDVPRSWPELVATTRRVMEREPGIYGYIWQGRQYEGLVCNVLEYVWSNGGEVLQDGRCVIDSPENAEALRFVRDLIARYGVTPPLVTTAIEETTRHLFGGGRALFMRNWPYAWTVFQREGSPVRGKVGVAPLPSFPGRPSASTLGGWQLGVNRYSKRAEAAEKLVVFLTSPQTQKRLALTLGYKPTRKSLYADADLRREQPFIVGLYDIFMKARPRPVTPYYMMMTQVIQSEFSAAVSGIRPPEEALLSARRQIDHILGTER
jgi:trehalose/maltose transport system substrate-binding protein